MSAGKSGGTSTTIPALSPEQNAMIAAQTGLFTGTVGPAYQQAVTGATNLYNNTATGLTNAAQNLAGTSAQAQNVLGSTGESALQTGISGLENLYSPAYQQQQLNAVLQPAEAQYQQNLANQNTGFGASGQIGSSRQALANTQLAGMNQMNQQQAAATVMNNIAQQQQSAATSLAGLGQTGINNSLSAATQGITAAMAPQQLYNQYASVLFGTPSSSYSPSFAGTQGTTTNTSAGNLGISI
jgi:hypothetical protein